MKITSNKKITLFLVFISVITSYIIFPIVSQANYKTDLFSLPLEDRTWVERACSGMKDYGPSSYIGCIRREINALNEDSKPRAKPPSTKYLPDPWANGFNPYTGVKIQSPPNDLSSISNDKEDTPNLNVDSGLVSSQEANLREEPNKNSKILDSITQGHLVVLLEREPIDGWFHVINVETSQEGYLHQSTLKVFLSKNLKKSELFQAEKLNYISEPEIVIKNSSYKSINLKIGKQLIAIPANTSKNLTITQGTYDYYASSPSAIPLLGIQTFENSYRYSWEFWIEMKYGSRGKKR